MFATSSRFARPWHLAGAVLGLVLTLVGLGECPGSHGVNRQTDRGSVIATINERALTRSDLDALLANTDGDAESSERALDYLIDRELMLQRAEDVGLVESDPALRRALASALIATVEIPQLDETTDPADRRQAADLARQQLEARRRAFIDQLRQAADIEYPADRAIEAAP